MRSSSQDKVRQMLSKGADDFGSSRTVTEFANALGVDFEKRTLSEDAFNGGLEESIFDLTESASINVLKDILHLVTDVMKM